jgi:chromate reductase
MNDQEKATSRVRILGISGSLRKRSLNTALLQAGASLLPSNVDFKLADISDFPLYDDDLREGGYPQSVARFRNQIDQADAIWIATPEYNFSYSGVLKNAIDWASRPPSQPFLGKPVAIMGASAGMLGTARAQYHLRQVFIYLNAYVLNTPEVFVGNAQTKFTNDLELTDENTRTALTQHMKAFLDWTARVKHGLPLA